jgi:hypothetical protein
MEGVATASTSDLRRYSTVRSPTDRPDHYTLYLPDLTHVSETMNGNHDIGRRNTYLVVPSA